MMSSQGREQVRNSDSEEVTMLHMRNVRTPHFTVPRSCQRATGERARHQVTVGIGAFRTLLRKM